MTRRTVDLPDDLADELQKINNKTGISQVNLLAIGGYSLVSLFKKEGFALFAPGTCTSNERVTLIPDETPGEAIRYVKDHIAEFGNIIEFTAFGIDNVPENYCLPTVNGKHTHYTKYRFILKNEKGREWWFAGCCCGYAGNSVSGAQEVLTLLSIPFPFERLVEENEIHHQATQELTLRITLARLEIDNRRDLVTYELSFRNASDKYHFRESIEGLGFISERPHEERRNEWASAQDIEICRKSILDDEAMKQAFSETLYYLVRYRFRGNIKEIN